MYKRTLCQLSCALLLSWFFLAAQGQSKLLEIAGFDSDKMSIRKLMQEGEYYFLYEDYQEALHFYKQIDTTRYTNANVKYHIGLCYLFTPFNKPRAISYLEKAVENITPDYRGGSLNETHAPEDAYYYLGQAYLIDNQYEKACKVFEKFRATIKPGAIYDLVYINQAIESCLSAKELTKKPIDVEFVNVNGPVNDRFSNIRPTVNGSGEVMVYTSKRKFYDAILFSKKRDGKWSSPVNITPQIGSDGDFYPTGISNDGKTLLLNRQDLFEGDIYISYFSDESGQWSKAKKVEGDVNSSAWESHASFSHDNKTIYFASDRDGGYGGLDIYRVTVDNDGKWEDPVNLGAQVNTPFDEDTPFSCRKGKKLFFSSRGHKSMGGFDVFSSTIQEDGGWDRPRNIGYPLNTTDDDQFFVPLEDGKTGFISTFGKGGNGKFDIYRVEIK